ncbi:MAG TPA: hypothetical protein VFZ65_16295 [Planctomycetota bacterium]|nr:hypothetical protein [Planctomycetota bacterium]
MASSPASPEAVRTTPTAFALQELTACWDQGYEALARGDLERLGALMDIAGEHLAGLAGASFDSAAEAGLRQAAAAARGRLEHGMRTGLQGLQDEIARARHGGKVLRGYADTSRRLGGNVEKHA